MTEDPSNRRLYPNGHRLFVLQLVPMQLPQVVQTSNGPAVVHSSDFSLVTAASPAHAGEILSLLASGLGPTQTVCPSPGGTGGTLGTCPPGVTPLQPGNPFPANPLALVNAPVGIAIGGVPAVVPYAGGYPGTTDNYQVNFVVPGGIPSGPAVLQLTAAWVAGPPVTIPIH